MGGVLYHCSSCNHKKYHYRSCRNRNCPACQQIKQVVWADKLMATLLPVKHFHVVFTLPQTLHALFYLNQKTCYDLFFKCSAHALQRLIKHDYHAIAGAMAVLHTWGQTLNYHPHLHYVVTAGGADQDNMQWVRSHPKFLVDVKELSGNFRSMMLAEIEKLWVQKKLKLPEGVPDIFSVFALPLKQKAWNVYCEKPLKGPKQIINYLARYVNRVAISNSRIISQENQTVTFRYNNYRNGQYGCLMKLQEHEFVSRFLRHITPKGFYRIRYYGAYAQCGSAQRTLCFALLNASQNFPKYQGLPLVEVAEDVIKKSFWKCPKCESGCMAVYSHVRPLYSKLE